MLKFSKRITAVRSAAARKKNSEGVKLARAKETPAQRELHNAKLAVAYRWSRADYLFDTSSYKGRKAAEAWIAVAEERLRKAEDTFKACAEA